MIELQKTMEGLQSFCSWKETVGDVAKGMEGGTDKSMKHKSFASYIFLPIPQSDPGSIGKTITTQHSATLGVVCINRTSRLHNSAPSKQISSLANNSNMGSI
jgi:hypothetical protein